MFRATLNKSGLTHQVILDGCHRYRIVLPLALVDKVGVKVVAIRQSNGLAVLLILDLRRTDDKMEGTCMHTHIQKER